MNGQKMPEYLNAAYEGDDLFTGDQLRVAVAAEREEIDRLKALCQEMLSELYVYRASEYLKDVTAAIKARK